MLFHSVGNRGLVSSSIRDVFYCCGRCGDELNLSSSNRNTSANIGAEYGKPIQKGVVSFASIDESRFTQVDEIRCLPFFRSCRFWGRRRRTRLLCCRCGSLIGVATYVVSSSASSSSDGSSESYSRNTGFRKCMIRICALQPLFDD